MIRFLWLFLTVFLATQAKAAVFDHSKWDMLLKQYVLVLDGGKVTQVDYDGFLRDRGKLTDYLDSLAEVNQDEFDSYPLDYQLAFLINAYNGWTVELILTRYPGLKSIKDLGSFLRSPWKKQFAPLLGKIRSLDEIEHSLIRGSARYDDPRIHFAVNCASIGCPALRAEAYSGEKLQEQLAEASELFLADRERNRLRDETLEVSSIFKWYREDFEQGSLGIGSLGEFFAHHAQSFGLNEEMKEKAKSGEVKIIFLKYDWSLNKKDN